MTSFLRAVSGTDMGGRHGRPGQAPPWRCFHFLSQRALARFSPSEDIQASDDVEAAFVVAHVLGSPKIAGNLHVQKTRIAGQTCPRNRESLRPW